jgi:hypothetical protein
VPHHFLHPRQEVVLSASRLVQVDSERHAYGRLSEGATVVLTGLVKRPDLNGQIAHVEKGAAVDDPECRSVIKSLKSRQGKGKVGGLSGAHSRNGLSSPRQASMGGWLAEGLHPNTRFGGAGQQG